MESETLLVPVQPVLSYGRDFSAFKAWRASRAYIFTGDRLENRSGSRWRRQKPALASRTLACRV